MNENEVAENINRAKQLKYYYCKQKERLLDPRTCRVSMRNGEKRYSNNTKEMLCSGCKNIDETIIVVESDGLLDVLLQRTKRNEIDIIRFDEKRKRKRFWKKFWNKNKG